jgi:two-component system, cell cycle sensor histidine kinase and response regulator CckA
MNVRHSLLLRQLKRLFGGLDRVPPEWTPLVEAVDRAYAEADTDRLMLERSLDLSSQELLQANAQLRRGYADLERRVEERTADLLAVNQALRDEMTERRRVEEQLRQSQKLEAIGRLAGGIAHDFNNLLTVITGYSGLLISTLPPDDPNAKTVEEIRFAADRAASLTRQLLAFSRRQVLQPKVLALNTSVTHMEQMLRRLIGEHIALNTELAPDLGLVKADPNQLDQVLINLAVNARDAMPHGGRLTIATDNVCIDTADAAQQSADLQPGTYVRLCVSDTGRGMNAETRAHIFEPFFTTKGPGEGTGLGLATVYGIVRQSGGTIIVRSEPGAGTSFRIYLPRLPDTVAPPVALHAEDTRSKGGGETILLVEDEEAVRRLAQQVLREKGYEVVEVRNCADAILASERYAGPIHLLLTDVVMPDGTGRTVAERLQPRRPEMLVLYMSGYADETILRHGVLGTGTPLLQKPFTATELARRVREALDTAGR